jgi:D,D-heptose 1,7-bisphosphate phosphatase
LFVGDILAPVQPAVFLDRDNTLIQNDGDLGQPDQVRLVQGVASGLAQLRESGYHLVVVTNQAGVARGVFTEEDVDAVHQRIALMVDEQSQRNGVIDRFYYCPYHPEGKLPEYRRDHLWRKPHPGMILQASQDMEIDLSRSWMVGDQERDIQAGKAAGCRTILVTKRNEVSQKAAADVVVPDFAQAVQVILKERSSSRKSQGNGMAPASAVTPAPTKPAASNELGALRKSVADLIEEIRADRLRKSDFTLLRMLAGLCQLLAIVLAVLGLLQLENGDVFMKWMIGAGLAQLFTITLLLLDLKG